jgi:hypothetical protein
MGLRQFLASFGCFGNGCTLLVGEAAPQFCAQLLGIGTQMLLRVP